MYFHFGGAALCDMLHQRYDHIRRRDCERSCEKRQFVRNESIIQVSHYYEFMLNVNIYLRAYRLRMTE